MKIGFDAKRAFCNSSGLGNYSRNIISAINEFYPQNDYSLFTPSIKKYSDFAKNINAEIITPKSIWNYFPSLWRSVFLSSIIKKYDIDIFHGLSNELPPGIIKEKSKKVVTIHDLIFLRHPELFGPINSFIYKYKTNYAITHADAIIAVSNQTKYDLMEFFHIPGNKISVIYQPCNPYFLSELDENYALTVKQNYHLPEKFILSVGNIEERKNIYSVLKAIHLHNIDIPLYIIGRKTDYVNFLKGYIKLNNIQNVHFLHSVNTMELKVFYHLAELLIYPSIFEGFGIPLIEALSCNTPVITNKDGCFQEAAGNGGYYVDVKNIDELADAMTKMLEDNALRDKLVKEGKEHIKKFDRQVIASNIIDLYESLL
ncbi:glycosyltransferase family 4 protein [Odoribacter sp. OttesenSCG-928-L07]|nr:glycosyltransferase family 4 protein [Odoribacter sp. OttesenSCG-928-L07]MDL2239572.1 glycosyltransferase family 4 protein [Bacteroidales bacterium OttesenSCG-928-L14]MDL2241049.1 glycosyltransferase family 4 protein [Bacteroidales bacterium OttesenSCG-928-K22]